MTLDRGGSNLDTHGYASIGPILGLSPPDPPLGASAGRERPRGGVGES